MKVVVTGYYGAGNAGDELILTALTSLLRSRFHPCDIVALSMNPSETQALHGVRALYRGPFALGGTRPFGWFQSEWKGIIREIREADLLLVGGGGLLEDIHNFGSIPMYLHTVFLARFLGTPVAGVGLGAGPLLTPLSRLLVRLGVNQMSHVSVRDEESRKQLVRAGVNPALVSTDADLVFGLYGSDVCPSRRSSQLRIAVTVGQSDWLQVDLARLAQALMRSHASVGFDELVLFPMGFVPGDQQAVKRLSTLITMPHSVEQPPRSSRDFLEYVSRFDGIVSAKLHGVVAAAIAGVPVVALSYSPKVTSAAELLGIPCYRVDNIDSDALGQAIIAMCQGNRDSTDHVVTRLADQAERGLVETIEKTLSPIAARRPWLLLAALAFSCLTPLSLGRQVFRSLRGNAAWAARQDLPNLGQGSVPAVSSRLV